MCRVLAERRQKSLSLSLAAAASSQCSFHFHRDTRVEKNESWIIVNNIQFSSSMSSHWLVCNASELSWLEESVDLEKTLKNTSFSWIFGFWFTHSSSTGKISEETNFLLCCVFCCSLTSCAYCRTINELNGFRMRIKLTKRNKHNEQKPPKDVNVHH